MFPAPRQRALLDDGVDLWLGVNHSASTAIGRPALAERTHNYSLALQRGCKSFIAAGAGQLSRSTSFPNPSAHSPFRGSKVDLGASYTEMPPSRLGKRLYLSAKRNHPGYRKPDINDGALPCHRNSFFDVFSESPCLSKLTVAQPCEDLDSDLTR